MTTYEKWNLAFQAIGALMVFGGLIYAGRQFRLYRQSESRNIKIQSLDYAERLMAEIREPLATIRGRREELQKYPLPTDLIESAHFVLNSFEDMFFRLREGVYDEETIRQVWGITVAYTYDLLGPIVAHSRKQTRNVTLWESTSQGVARWGFLRR